MEVLVVSLVILKAEMQIQDLLKLQHLLVLQKDKGKQ